MNIGIINKGRFIAPTSSNLDDISFLSNVSNVSDLNSLSSSNSSFWFNLMNEDLNSSPIPPPSGNINIQSPMQSQFNINGNPQVNNINLNVSNQSPTIPMYLASLPSPLLQQQFLTTYPNILPSPGVTNPNAPHGFNFPSPHPVTSNNNDNININSQSPASNVDTAVAANTCTAALVQQQKEIAISDSNLNLNTNGNHTITTVHEIDNVDVDQHELDNAAEFLKGKFLTMYYDALQHSQPQEIKRFYHLDAGINRSCLTQLDTPDMSMEQKLNLLHNKITSVDIKSAIHQKSICNSILLRINGIMRFIDDINPKSFEQVFIMLKDENGFWLIQNDILVLDSIDKHTEKEEEKQLSDDSINSQTENLNNFNLNINRPKMPKFGSPQIYHDQNVSWSVLQHQIVDLIMCVFILILFQLHMILMQ